MELYKPLVTIGSIVGFAYVANYSGMSITIGNALTVTGRFFPFIAPLLGWFGVFITGSDTSSNALFSGIQARTAHSIGISPVLTVAANSTGGVAAKMISPQSIAVATASTKLTGQEGRLFRFTILHSIGLGAYHLRDHLYPSLLSPMDDSCYSDSGYDCDDIRLGRVGGSSILAVKFDHCCVCIDDIHQTLQG